MKDADMCDKVQGESLQVVVGELVNAERLWRAS